MGTVREDGLVNITALSTAYRNTTKKRKDPSKWLATSEAIESIAYLVSSTQKCVDELVQTKEGGNGGGTWVHPDLAEIFAQWCSVEYRFAVVQLIRVAKENKPQTPHQLPPSRDIIDYAQMAIAFGIQDDPIIKSLVTQRLAEQLSPGIKAIDAPEQPLNVTSIASNLGFSQQAIGNGSALGKYIASRHQPLGTSQHGKYQVNVYLPSEVEASVKEFFAPVAV